MRHRKKRHLRGDKDRRRKELRALATSVILHDRIETTKSRAKITKTAVEKMVTKGKKGGLTAIRLLRKDLPENAVKKVIEVFAPRFQSRPGGYTRILHAGKYKDGTDKVLLEFVK
ncbi:MAG: 50S ribosomal protein L17 [Candidatus Doudnabacteria bacterium RIFCSPHIGHO2_02_FULL_48_21]|uniref:50S ribosomal protein L17 n=1 Tax=Candidatus Doudnabacteria bacterium RIFCSPLOWO2_02_FULL_48_13 TaxID=1817845 RepID=A0A1F5Q971_9BACT|nr:MAG: 50S ribosomal protein L17 [Candidatus Doudnabacteria bacterium RIFCSPHIGHO2_01_48_18]OGE77230.1 MAG: 50S ribosomal protein L17 [Candidatus Doudnabacteria bacterium RIFCSPHIGHO2_01_FULL_48_180]OGE91088.1 MAG: 50S ribosomal protein L17 [Candidatus Doudnabacteria bacterium RIFCSPHIGHO2_12_FULL_47_25]OGE93778.1 MAG: 50S ribosomal protein L17 [Candidatus Doudnabacteria bacterium RIFCSPHIGHO2_02_FULL_48_21]OGE97153.1 MAG: 50S ribosomal protein L17 [Candidatus Doudnabacteria bacterium RIFCSPLO